MGLKFPASGFFLVSRPQFTAVFSAWVVTLFGWSWTIRNNRLYLWGRRFGRKLCRRSEQNIGAPFILCEPVPSLKSVGASHLNHGE